MDKINFDKLLKQFAEENVRQDTVKLMIDQLIKKGHCSTSAHEIIGFCILRMLDESAFGIKFTPEQNDKLLQIFTIEQMLQINDKLHDGVHWC
jgi:hypothetical protein